MSTPIEELLGWEPEGNVGWYDPEGEWHHHAEVDDLAAWLDTMLGHGNWWPQPITDGWAIVVEDDVMAHADLSIAKGSTPREALVAAVRKVAGE